MHFSTISTSRLKHFQLTGTCLYVCYMLVWEPLPSLSRCLCFYICCAFSEADLHRDKSSTPVQPSSFFCLPKWLVVNGKERCNRQEQGGGRRFQPIKLSDLIPHLSLSPYHTPTVCVSLSFLSLTLYRSPIVGLRQPVRVTVYIPESFHLFSEDFEEAVRAFSSEVIAVSTWTSPANDFQWETCCLQWNTVCTEEYRGMMHLHVWGAVFKLEPVDNKS